MIVLTGKRIHMLQCIYNRTDIFSSTSNPIYADSIHMVWYLWSHNFLFVCLEIYDNFRISMYNNTKIEKKKIQK